MNKKQTTMLASVATVTLVGAMLLLGGVLNTHIADAAKTSSRFSSDPSEGAAVGHGSKIIVEIDSPFGFERITSFMTFNTDNLMKKNGYHTLKLQGTIQADKRTLLNWIANDLGELPDGLAAKVETHGGKAVQMTKAKDGATIEKRPLKGKVTLRILDPSMGMFENRVLRNLEFSGCHVAGYHLGTLHDNDRPYLEQVRYQHYEQVDFACASIKDLRSQDMDNRGIIVQRPHNASTREQVIDENGALIITSREYRQPIVLESYQQVETEQQVKEVKQEIVTRIELDKLHYQADDSARFTITFTDIEGNTIDPDITKTLYDGKIVQLDKQEFGVYTYTTPGLNKAHHQLIVSAEKDGFAADTSYLSIPMHRVN